ncbi:MAG: hypothetical protein ACK40O_05175 [Allosphingosinicella sp.]
MAPILFLLLLILALPVVSAVAAAFRFQRIRDGEGGEPGWAEALQAGPTQLKHFSRARDMVARHGAASPAPTRGAVR